LVLGPFLFSHHLILQEMFMIFLKLEFIIMCFVLL